MERSITFLVLTLSALARAHTFESGGGDLDDSNVIIVPHLAPPVGGEEEEEEEAQVSEEGGEAPNGVPRSPSSWNSKRFLRRHSLLGGAALEEPAHVQEKWFVQVAARDWIQL